MDDFIVIHAFNILFDQDKIYELPEDSYFIKLWKEESDKMSELTKKENPLSIDFNNNVEFDEKQLKDMRKSYIIFKTFEICHFMMILDEVLDKIIQKFCNNYHSTLLANAIINSDIIKEKYKIGFLSLNKIYIDIVKANNKKVDYIFNNNVKISKKDNDQLLIMFPSTIRGLALMDKPIKEQYLKSIIIKTRFEQSNDFVEFYIEFNIPNRTLLTAPKIYKTESQVKEDDFFPLILSKESFIILYTGLGEAITIQPDILSNESMITLNKNLGDSVKVDNNLFKYNIITNEEEQYNNKIICNITIPKVVLNFENRNVFYSQLLLNTSPILEYYGIKGEIDYNIIQYK